jgi:hypothetical protein
MSDDDEVFVGSENSEKSDSDELEIESSSQIQADHSKLNMEEAANSYKRYYKFVKGDIQVKCLTCGKTIKRGKSKNVRIKISIILVNN